MVTRKQTKTEKNHKGGMPEIPFDSEKCLVLLEEGNTISRTAQLMGMAERTLYYKIADFKQNAENAVAIKKSQEIGKQVNIDKITSPRIFDLAIEQAEKGNVTLLIYLLKAVAGWKETTRQELTGADGGSIQIKETRPDLSKVPTETLEKIYKAMYGDSET